jgi:hypothetical protein
MPTLNGGEVIDSGGFGCVFKPSIKCKNKKHIDTQASYISKLMTKKNAEEEYDITAKVNNILSKLPNYKRYFIIHSFYLCKPVKLTQKDLTRFNKKCSALKKKNYTRKNINKNLDNLLALNMPYGGITVNQYIDKYIDNPSRLVHLNNSMIELLKNGIVVMNNMGVYNCDVKGSNILINPDEHNSHARIIDWGLSIIFKNHHKKIPDAIRTRPFQYNTPYSIILFNDLFDESYEQFLTDHDWSKNKNPILLNKFIVEFISLWIDTRGEGHLAIINNDIQHIFPIEHKLNNIDIPFHLIKYSASLNYIVPYIFNVLSTFTINNRFNKHKYFSTVFIKNIDVWGLVMSYPHPYTPIEKLRNNTTLPIFQNIINHLFESSSTPINIDFITYNLYSLNKLY